MVGIVMDYLYQIYYSDQTKKNNDKGFLPLDNLNNPRPDWREYWPIRSFLLKNKLEKNCRYGFFSPKFYSKTGMDSTAVHRILTDTNADVVLFSPFFDQSAFFRNVFLQSEQVHPRSSGLFSKALAEVGVSVDYSSLINHSGNTVFCNYFVAVPEFWKSWFELCERIFDLLESEPNHLLNQNTTHDYRLAPFKVFLIERIATILLTNSKWTTYVCNPIRMSIADKRFAPHIDMLCQLDALKVAYTLHGHSFYMQNFMQLRLALIDRIRVMPRLVL